MTLHLKPKDELSLVMVSMVCLIWRLVLFEIQAGVNPDISNEVH